MRQLVLVRHAPTAATEHAAFPGDEPLDARARATAAQQLRGRLPLAAAPVCSPALRARETAAACGLDPEIEPLLRECDFGTWAGRTLAQIHSEDPDGAVSWMTDPAAAPHGGESLFAFGARVSSWMDAQAKRTGSAVAITHAGVIAAAVTHALGAPVEAVWRIKPAPLSLTRLVANDGSWVVEQLGACR